MKKVFLFLSIFFLLSCSEDKHRQAMDLYEQGKAQEERGAADSAILTYNKAIVISERIANKQLQGKIYNQVGELYLFHSLYSNAQDAFEKAFRCNVTLKEKSQASYSLRGIGKSYAYRLKPDSALYYHLQAYKLVPQINDSNEIIKIYNNLAGIYLSLKRFKEAEEYNTKTLNLAKDSIIIYRCYSIKSKILLIENQIDSASIYFKKGIQSSNLYTKAACYLQLADLAKQTGDSNQTKYLEQAHLLGDSIQRLNQSANIAVAERQYIQTKISKEKESLAAWITGVFIVCGLIIFLFLLYYHKNKINLEKEEAIKAKRRLQEKEKLVKEQHVRLQLMKSEFNTGNTQDKIKEEVLSKLNKLTEQREKSLNSIMKVGESCKKSFQASEIYSILKKTIKDTNSVLPLKQ